MPQRRSSLSSSTVSLGGGGLPKWNFVPRFRLRSPDDYEYVAPDSETAMRAVMRSEDTATSTMSGDELSDVAAHLPADE